MEIGSVNQSMDPVFAITYGFPKSYMCVFLFPQTDDKGVFATSLSREYEICVNTFSLTSSQTARLALNACQYIFADNARKMLNDKLLNFIGKHSL